MNEGAWFVFCCRDDVVLFQLSNEMHIVRSIGDDLLMWFTPEEIIFTSDETGVGLSNYTYSPG